jgi:hypothetical protein
MRAQSVPRRIATIVIFASMIAFVVTVLVAGIGLAGPPPHIVLDHL